MAPFDPISALAGGVLIGLASVLLMLLTGRIAGISGILGGVLAASANDRDWRLAFIAGLILAPLLSGLAGYSLPLPDCWSASAAGWAAAAPPAMASADLPASRRARSPRRSFSC
jgi:uncharacterized protein